MSDIPNPLAWTDRWAVRSTAAVFGLLVVSNLLVNEPAEWVPMCFMSLVMGPVAYWGVRGLLRFQRFNAAMMSPRVFRAGVWFFWAAGVLNVLMITYCLVRWPAPVITWAFGVSMGVGCSLAAARSWQDGVFFAKQGRRDAAKQM